MLCVAECQRMRRTVPLLCPATAGNGSAVTLTSSLAHLRPTATPPIPPTHSFLGAGIALSILWRLALPAHHAHWREGLALVLRMTGLGLGLGLGLGVQHVWELIHNEAFPGGAPKSLVCDDEALWALSLGL